MKCKNKEFSVMGVQSSPLGVIEKELHVVVTNNEIGKTLSIDNGTIQFSIPLEDIVAYLK